MGKKAAASLCLLRVESGPPFVRGPPDHQCQGRQAFLLGRGRTVELSLCFYFTGAVNCVTDGEVVFTLMLQS